MQKALRVLILLTLKDPVNMESVVFHDPKNITRGGVYCERLRLFLAFFELIGLFGTL